MIKNSMNTKDFASFLNSISSQPIPILDRSIPLEKYVTIDLSESNKELKSLDIKSSVEWEQYIAQYCQNRNAKVAFGGYKETRNIYKRSTYFNNSLKFERNIHLGIDFWISEGTKIFTPLTGKVHSFANNTNLGDYGPTIILEHKVNEVQFYTLYGHLSLDSIKNLKIGAIFKEQDCIARLGGSKINGDYAPHLHFQVIKDIQNYQGDYPGVCNKRNLKFYSANCPDPNALLKLI